jgi:hypothetical protein
MKCNCCTWPASYLLRYYKTQLENDHPYTCNYTTENSKLTFTASNHTQFHATAKMEKPKYKSIGDILSLINM